MQYLVSVYIHVTIILVSCSDAGNSDRVVIQEMLKTVAQSQQLETSSQRDFKGEGLSVRLGTISAFTLEYK